jgi:ABC-type branched-subunit amino acid transport system permease subunit
VRPAFPFVVLAVFLVARRTLHQPATASDPLAAVDPPAPSLRPPPRMREVATGTRAFTALIAVMFVVVTLALVPGNWEFTLTQGLVLSIVFLSITLLTGMGGMISLCQAAFAGVGAFTAGQLAMHFNVPVMIGTVAGGLLAAAVGALVSLPTLRLGGVTLALLTLSFALVADNVLFVYSWAGNGASGVIVPRPTIVGLSFAGNAAFFWLALVVLAIAATAVRLLRDGTVGEELTAFRGSETASSAIGIDVRRLRITAFTLSAATAGIGGAMYGSLQGSVSPNDFNYQFSLVFMVVVATVGVYTVAGAIEAGVAYTVLQQLIANLPSRYGSLLAVLFGAAAITYVRHPEGAVAFAERWVLDRAEQLARRLKGDEPVGGQGGGRVHDDPSAVGARAGRA